MQLAWLPVDEWRALLEQAGFEVVACYGWFDLRPFVADYHLPERMDGMRVLDVGTWDGFWAFEFERRGAEVVGLDILRQFAVTED